MNNAHRLARTTPHLRALLVRRIEEEGWRAVRSPPRERSTDASITPSASSGRSPAQSPSVTTCRAATGVSGGRACARDRSRSCSSSPSSSGFRERRRLLYLARIMHERWQA